MYTDHVIISNPHTYSDGVQVTTYSMQVYIMMIYDSIIEYAYFGPARFRALFLY